jgi:phage-related protein
MADAGDRLGAQKVVLAEVNREFGGAAGAAATPAAKLSAAWANLEEQVGTALLPILNKLVGFMTNDVVPAIRGVISWFQNNAGTVKTVAMVLAPLVAAWAAYALITKTVAIAQAILNAVMLANPIVLIVVALVALTAAIVIAYQRSATFRAILQGVWDFLKTWGPAILAIFFPVLGIPLLIWQHWSQIITFVTRAWNAVYGFIKKWGPAALAVLAPFIGIPLLIWQHWSQISGFVSRAWSAVSSTISRWASSTYHAVLGWVGNIVSAVASLPGKIGAVAGRMLSAGKSLMTGLWNGLKSVASGAADLARGLVEALKNGINDLLGLPLTVPRIKIGAFGHYVHIGGQTLIPRLATGGLVDGQMMAVLGDNPSGKELVAPLDSPKTVDLLAAAMGKARGSDGGEAGTFTDDQIDRLIAAIMASHELSVDGQKLTAVVNTRNLRNGRWT